MHSACAQTPSPTAAHPPSQPQLTVLHQIVENHIGDLIELREQQGQYLPAFVLRAFQKFRECGDPRFGYVSIDCANCGEILSVPLSCKQRSFCPRCLLRRMIDGGTFISERIIGDNPVRHLVLTLPPPLRYALTYKHSLLAKLVKASVKVILKFMRRKAKKILGLKYVKHAYPGAISSIHRSSSNLDANVHLHVLVTDGVFVRDEPNGFVSFRDLPALTDGETAEIAWRICRRTTDILRASGLWRDIKDDSGDTSTNAPKSTQTPAREIRGVLSLGPKSGKREVTFFGRAAGRSQGDQGGYSFDLYAKRAIARGDHKGLKKLVEYILHPPFTDQQLSLTPDGRVMLKSDRPWQKETKPIFFDQLEFLIKLIALVPRPRSKTVRFHGVYAPNATLREEVLPKVTVADPASPNQSSGTSDRGRRMSWFERLKRDEGVDLSRCPRCSSPTRVRIEITHWSIRRRILDGAGLAGDSHDPPPTHAPNNRVVIH